MSLPNVNIIEGNGDTGQQPAGQDFISGKVFYTNSLPSGFSSGNRVKMVTSVASAEALGVLNTFSDETQSTQTIACSHIGATGDSVTINFQEPGQVVALCTYIQKSTDTTTTLLAASIAASINANTSLTGGYTAMAAAGTITITARKGLGIWPNSGTIITTVIVSSLMTFGAPALGVSGVASLLAVWHYHISEFFRENPTGILWVGFFAVPTNSAGYTYAEITQIESASSGAVRQVLVYVNNPNGSSGSSLNSAATLMTWISGSVGLIQGVVNTNYTNKMPLSVLLAVDLTLLSGITNLTLDLGTLTGTRVSVVISQDGANAGWFLWQTSGFSITDGGAKLGAVSAAAVSDSIADVAQFNMTDGVELSVPAFADGTLYSAADPNFVAQLDTWRYIFLRTFVGKSGSYNNNDHCAVSVANQFNYIRKGRTFDKAYRLLYPAYLPYLNGKLPLNSDGTLAPTTVATLQNVGFEALDVMVRDGDLSGRTVVVPSAQNPNTSGILNITVNLLGVPVAMQINVTSQFVNSL